MVIVDCERDNPKMRLQILDVSGDVAIQRRKAPMLSSLRSLLHGAKSQKGKISAWTGRRLTIETLKARVMLAATPPPLLLLLLPQLEVSANGRYLVEEDSTPFYWQSDDI